VAISTDILIFSHFLINLNFEVAKICGMARECEAVDGARIDEEKLATKNNGCMEFERILNLKK
jgi:hypothetical protein